MKYHPPDSSGPTRIRAVIEHVEFVYRSGVLPILEIRGDGVPSPTTAAEGRETDQGIVSLGIHHGDARDPATPHAEVHVSTPGSEPDEAWILGLPPRIPGLPLGGTPAHIPTDAVPFEITIDDNPAGHTNPRRHDTDWIVLVPYGQYVVTVAGHRWEPAGRTLELHTVADVSPYIANFAATLNIEW